ncbi:uncharacterized protein ACIBXB_020510 [Morphnus guianensis]
MPGCGGNRQGDVSSGKSRKTPPGSAVPAGGAGRTGSVSAELGGFLGNASPGGSDGGKEAPGWGGDGGEHLHGSVPPQSIPRASSEHPASIPGASSEHPLRIQQASHKHPELQVRMEAAFHSATFPAQGSDAADAFL